MDFEYEGCRTLLRTGKAPVYLLHGDPQSEFLICEFSDLLVNYLAGTETREDCLRRFDAADGTSLDAVLDAAAPTLFSTTQIIVLDNAQMLNLTKSGKDSKVDSEKYSNYSHIERLQRFAASPPADTHIIFLAYEDMMPTGKTAAAGQRSEKMLKRAFGAVRNAGHTARFRKLYSDNYLGWLARRLDEAGLKVDRGVTEVFLARAGEDLRRLAMEVDKLALFVGPNGRVTDELVRGMVSTCIDQFMSDMMHAVVGRDGKTAVEYLETALLGSAQPVFIVSSAASHLRLLWQARYLMEMGYFRKAPPEYRSGGMSYMAAETKRVPLELAGSLAVDKGRNIIGIHAFRAFHMFQEARKMALPDIEKAQRRLLDIDCRVKGILNPKFGSDEMMLEMFVADTAGRPRRSAG